MNRTWGRVDPLDPVTTTTEQVWTDQRRHTLTTQLNNGGHIGTPQATVRRRRRAWTLAFAVALCTLTMVQTLPPADAAGGKSAVAKPGVTPTATGEQVSVNLSQ